MPLQITPTECYVVKLNNPQTEVNLSTVHMVPSNSCEYVGSPNAFRADKLTKRAMNIKLVEVIPYSKFLMQYHR
jgi:hypothetical protein